MLYLGKLPIAKEALKPTLKSLVMFAAYNLFFGLVPGIDNSAHLGGLAAGLGLGAVLARSYSEPPDTRARRRNYVTVGTTLLLLRDTPTSSRNHSQSHLQPQPSTCHPDRSGAQRAESRDLLFACATAKDQSQLIFDLPDSTTEQAAEKLNWPG